MRKRKLTTPTTADGSPTAGAAGNCHSLTADLDFPPPAGCTLLSLLPSDVDMAPFHLRLEFSLHVLAIFKQVAKTVQGDQRLDRH